MSCPSPPPSYLHDLSHKQLDDRIILNLVLLQELDKKSQEILPIQEIFLQQENMKA